MRGTKHYAKMRGRQTGKLKQGLYFSAEVLTPAFRCLPLWQCQTKSTKGTKSQPGRFLGETGGGESCLNGSQPKAEGGCPLPR